MHRLVHDRAPLTSLAVTVALVVALLGVHQTVASDAVDGAARAGVTTAPVTDRAVVVTLPLRGDLDAADEVVRTRLASPGRFSRVVSATARGVAGRSGSDRALLAEVSGLTERARLVQGRWPTTPASEGAEVDVTVPIGVTRSTGWRIGRVVTLPSLVDPASDPVRVRIVGAWEADRADPVWADLPVGLTGVARGDYTTLGPFVVPEGTLARVAPSGTTVVWRLVPDLAGLDAGSAPGQRDRWAQVSRDLEAQPTLRRAQIGTPVVALLDRAAATSARVALVLTTPLLLVLLVGGLAIVVAAGVLGRWREQETRLLRSRGAGGRTMTAFALVDAALVVLPATVVGGALGPVVSAAAGADVAWRTAYGWATWTAAGLAVVVLLLTSLRSGRLTAPARSGPLDAGLDVVVVALGLAAVWQLRRSGLSSDLLTVLATCLVVGGLATVALRVLPLIARLGELVAPRGSRLPPAWVSWQLSRRLASQRGALMLVLVGVSLAAVGLVQPATAERAFRDQAELAVGAPLRLVPGAEIADDPGLAASYARIAGGADRAVRVRSDTVRLGAAGDLPVLSLDADRAREVTTVRPDLLPGMGWAELTRRLAAARTLAGVELPGSPRRLTVDVVAHHAAHAPGAVSAAPVLLISDAGGSWTRVPLGEVASEHATTRTVELPAHLAAAPRPLRLVAAAATFRIGKAQRRPVGGASSLELRSVRTEQAPVDVAGLVERSAADEVVTSVRGPRVTVPVVLDAAVARRAGLGPGSLFGADLVGRRVSWRVVDVADALPAGAAGLADLPTAQVAVAGLGEPAGAPARVPPVLTAQQWWLDPADPGAADAALGRAPRLAVERVDREVLIARRLDQPVNAGVRAALRLTGVAGLLLATIGFGAAAVVLRRDRRREEAVLEALGLAPAAMRSLAVQERSWVAALGVLTGAGMGVAVAALVAPALTVADGAATAAPVRLALPWGELLFLLALASTLLLGAARPAPRRRSGAAVILREGSR